MINEVVLSFTDRCNAACRHCAVNAGPDKQSHLDPDDFIPHIDALSKYGVRRITFTGGEPTLFIEDMRRILRRTRPQGWGAVIYSNGHWATTPGNANNFAEKLQEMGVDCVVISTDVFHLEFIKYDTIRRAIGTLNDKSISSKILYTSSRRDRGLPEALKREGAVVEMSRFCPVGRGRELAGEETIDYPKRSTILNEPCRLMNQLVINHDGRIVRCCSVLSHYEECHSLSSFFELGDVRIDAMEDIWRRIERYSVWYRSLAEDGLKGIYRGISGHFWASGRKLERRYRSRCELCYDLLSNDENVRVLRTMGRNSTSGDLKP